MWRLRFFSAVESPIKHSSLDNKRTSPLSLPFQQSTVASLETKPFAMSEYAYQVADGFDCIIVTSPLTGTKTDTLLMEQGVDMHAGL